jgi:hypothetical protein
VSVAIPQYGLKANASYFIELLESKENPVGPTFKLLPLVQGTKSVKSVSGFAGEKDVKSDFGARLRVKLGASVRLEMVLAEADAQDEFAVEREGSELSFAVSWRLFDQLLSSLSGIDQVQSLSANDGNILVLRAQGVTVGIMRQGEQ